MERPDSIIFFPNGTAAVFDRNGKQMPRYQQGWHGTTIAALAADGINWETIHCVTGNPLREPPDWWVKWETRGQPSLGA